MLHVQYMGKSESTTTKRYSSIIQSHVISRKSAAQALYAAHIAPLFSAQAHGGVWVYKVLWKCKSIHLHSGVFFKLETVDIDPVWSVHNRRLIFLIKGDLDD